MADRTGFEQDLAGEVGAATEHARLAGPREVIERGRRRARARRGGMAVAGAAMIGGAYAAGGLPGGPSNLGAASPAASARQYGDGMLAVAQWPFQASRHWTVSEGEPMYGVAPLLISEVDGSPPQGPGAMFLTVACERTPMTDLTRYVDGRQRAAVRDWGTAPRGKNPPYPPRAGESVYTYTDAADAQQSLTYTLNALKAPCTAGQTLVRGATTDYGVSWVLRLPQGAGGDAPFSTVHKYLVVDGDRVATLEVEDVGTALADTSQDAKVLAAMRDALAH